VAATSRRGAAYRLMSMEAKLRTGRAAGHGRLAPFAEIVERHAADVWRFSASQVGRERADDVFQETMLAALSAYPGLRDPGSVRSWLLQIAARKSVDLFRAGSRAPVPVAEPEPAGDSGMAVDPEPRDEALWARVGALPEKQRQAVGLRFLLDLEYSDIGAAMRTSPEAARRSVFEALRTLRAQTAETATDHRTWEPG
jgi:RNA polymerase sigma factor (sigma-70 family)